MYEEACDLRSARKRGRKGLRRGGTSLKGLAEASCGVDCSATVFARTPRDEARAQYGEPGALLLSQGGGRGWCGGRNPLTARHRTAAASSRPRVRDGGGGGLCVALFARVDLLFAHVGSPRLGPGRHHGQDPLPPKVLQDACLPQTPPPTASRPRFRPSTAPTGVSAHRSGSPDTSAQAPQPTRHLRGARRTRRRCRPGPERRWPGCHRGRSPAPR